MPLHLFFYLSRLFMRWFSGIFCSFFLIVFIFDFFELQRKSSLSKSLPFFTKVGFLCFKTPYILEQVMPFLMFLSTLGFLSRLNRGNEILVLRTFGLSSWRIAKPCFFIAIVFGLLNLTVLQPLSVMLYGVYQKKEQQLLHKNPRSSFKILPSGFWIKKKHEGQSLIYHIQNVQEKTHLLEKVSLYCFKDANVFQKSYHATEGVLKKRELNLKNVWILSSGHHPVHQESLTLPFSLTLKELQNRSPPPQLISFWSLPTLIKWMSHAGMSPFKYQMEFQRLWALTFWFSGMVLLAVACGMRSQKQGGTLTLLILGLVCSLLLYFTRDLTYALGGARHLPMILATWSPCVLTFLVALVFLFFLEEGQKSRLF